MKSLSSSKRHDRVTDISRKTLTNDVWKLFAVRGTRTLYQHGNKNSLRWLFNSFGVHRYFERTWCVWDLRSLLYELCRTSLASTVFTAFSLNDKQKRHKTNPHEKQRHQNGLKQAPLCSAPGLEFCPHVPIWSLLLQSLKHKSQRHSHNHMTGTASGIRGRETVCQFACMH